MEITLKNVNEETQEATLEYLSPPRQVGTLMVSENNKLVIGSISSIQEVLDKEVQARQAAVAMFDAAIAALNTIKATLQTHTQ
jgi:hypothetical protein